MSLSPQKNRIILEAEIDKRIDPLSPTKYDINFYIRKVNRLEGDLSILQDELSGARVRLRKAQDFEIKYDLVLKQNNNLLVENERLSKELAHLMADNKKMKLKQEDQLSWKDEEARRKSNILNELEDWKRKYHESEEKRLTEASVEAGRVQSLSRRDLDSYRKDATERMQRYESEIRVLKRQIEEKDTVEKVVGMKVDRIRKEKDEEIARLNGLLEKQRSDYQSTILDKNQEVEKLQEKFQRMFNMELDNIKVNIEDQDEIFNIEMTSLKEMLSMKNDEISRLMASLKSQSDSHERERQQLKDELAELRDKIYKNQRQNEIQLYNVKERLTKIHSLDIENLEDKYRKLVATLRNQKAELERLLKAKEEQLQLDLKELERMKQEMHDKIREREHKIRELMERLRDTGAMNSNQMKVLHESFHKIESEKEAMATGYQQNIGFLDQQLKKMTASLQLRQAEIRTLQDELAFLKRTSQEDLRQMENKWKNERREREADRQRQRQALDKLEEEWLVKEKDWRLKERQLERERDKEQREKKRLGFVVEEFERDNARLNSYIKQLDEALKRQLKKNQLSTLDMGGIRRQMVSELEKQKSELQAIKKSEVDQAVKKLQIEISRLTSENQRLQTELTQRNVSQQSLQAQVKKLQSLSKNAEKINKEKLIDYQKKMATLNTEINLTQNLYKNFIEAKSRTGSKKDDGR